MSLGIVRALNRRCSNYITELGHFTACVRLYSTENAGQQRKSSAYSREAVRKNVQGYVFHRYIDYVKNYDKVLEKKFPSAMHVYRVFLVGVKDFYNDMKMYLKITRISNNSSLGLGALTRKELELYHKMPRDMFKVAPVLLLSTLPFANYVIFPLAYMYPRLLLTSHFWSIQQRSDFQQLNLKDRLEWNRKVFRSLQAKLETMQQDKHYAKWSYMLRLLGSGLHPTSLEVLQVKEIFARQPYHIDALKSQHIKQLCHLHNIHRGWFKRVRLVERAFLIHHMDTAIRREGGVHNMPIDSLAGACFLRGLNPTNMSNEKMIEWLEEWVKVSLDIDGRSTSLLLHLPILIGYNHPNNWQLIYK